MANEIKFDKHAKCLIEKGINILANAVKVTLGPKGKCVIIGDKNNKPKVTKDGVTVAKEISLSDKFMDLGAQLLKEVAIKTLNTVGDSTTTSIVLAQSIIQQGFSILNSHKKVNISEFINGINDAVEIAVDYINKNTISVTDKDIKHIATISANNDTKLGELIFDAFKQIGKNGVITVEESSNIDTSSKIINGMQIDKGYLSQHFVTNTIKDICELNNPYVLITEQKINNIRDISFILNQIAKEHKSLLLIAEDFDDSVLETLKFNKLEGILQVCAIKAPSFGEYRKSILNDIACLTNGTNVSYESGMIIKDVPINFLGTCKKVIVNKNSTTIIDGSGNKADILDYVNALKNNLKEIKEDPSKDNSFMIKFINERIAKLTGGIAVIYVGGTTEAEMLERKDRVDDAVAATRVAIEEGVVSGGGITYLNAVKYINSKIIYKSSSYKLGVNILKEALTAPFKTILLNAGLSFNKMKKHITPTIGVDVSKELYVNMYNSGIIDPAKAMKLALKNAASISILFLSTDCMIVKKDDNPFTINN